MSVIKRYTPEIGEIRAAVERRGHFYMNCEVCDKMINTRDGGCDHGKNGYCALFRLQAAKDIIEIHKK